MKSGIFSVLPWMTMAVTSNIGGWIADKLVQRGMTVTRVRKIMQSVRVASHRATQIMQWLGQRALTAMQTALRPSAKAANEPLNKHQPLPLLPGCRKVLSALCSCMLGMSVLCHCLQERALLPADRVPGPGLLPDAAGQGAQPLCSGGVHDGQPGPRRLFAVRPLL